MEILFVRHAQPAWIREGVNVNDPPLTEHGRRQAELLAERLSEAECTEILTSPAVRARQTAAPIGQQAGLEPSVETWLEEIRMPGAWEGATEEQVQEAFRQARGRPPEEWWDGMPGGETFRDFHQRVTKGLDEALAERQAVQLPDAPKHLWHIHEPGRNLVIVAHNGTNAAALGHLLGLEPVPWEWERFVLGHTGLARIKAIELGGGWVWSLRWFNDLDHLPRDLRTR